MHEPSNGQETASSASKTRKGRTALIATLFVAFPLGASTEREELYVEALDPVDFRDLQSAILTLISSHESSRVPPIGQIQRVCSEARGRRLLHQKEIEAEVSHHKLTEDEQRQVAVVHALGRAGIFWCSRTGGFAAPGEAFSSAEGTVRLGQKALHPTADAIYRAERRFAALLHGA